MIYWKCLNCDTNNTYPDNKECECCGEPISSDQIEEASRFTFYKQRADEGDTYAMMDMARFYSEGSIFKKDIESALKMMTKAAEMGNAEAQQELAEWYFYDDNDFPEDEEAAFLWATKAYNNKNPYSIYFLHRCYLYGLGTGVNKDKAKELLTEAANMGFALAYSDIANYYYYGKLFEKDEQMAAKYYMHLHPDDNCSMETAYNAGVFFWHGLGNIEVDYKKAIEWFEYAVNNYDDWGSKVALAKFHYDGTGYPKNQSLGLKMMTEIANNKSDTWAADKANKYLEIWKNNN